MPLPLVAAIGIPTLLASAVGAVTTLISGTKNRAHTQEIARLNVAQQGELENRRQQMQLVQSQLNYLQNRDNLAFQAEQAQLNREFQTELEAFRQKVQLEISRESLRFQSWKLEQEKVLQQQLASYGRETQQLLAAYQRETARQQPEVNKLYETWPLRIVPMQILKDTATGTAAPLKVIIAPPEVDFDKFGASVAGVPKLEKGLAEALRDFFGKYYPTGDKVRPVEFLGGAWDAKRFHGEASIAALFSMLRSESLLVLESEIDGDSLNMRFAYWAAGQERPAYTSVLTGFRYRDLVYESARERAKKWKAPHDLLLAQGKQPAQLNEIDTYNLGILEEEAQLASFGIDVSQLPSRYRVRPDDFETLRDFLAFHHRVVSGLIADMHHLLQHDAPPALARWLPEALAAGVTIENLQPVLDAYVQILQALAKNRPLWAADLALALANSLFPNKDWVEAVLLQALAFWQQGHGLPVTSTLTAGLACMPDHAGVEDIDFLLALQTCLTALGQAQAAADIGRDLSYLQRLRPAVAERALAPVWTPGQTFRDHPQAPEMVILPRGSFLMGSEDGRSNEKPVHRVSINYDLAVGKYPVTFEEWDAFAAETGGYRPEDEEWGRGRRPVINVSWDDAQDYVRWLSKKTGHTYRLLSEAEWEYACRAGTTTHYSFGDSESQLGEYAWYRDNSGSKTHPVGEKRPNVFGLFDMHGNVWEWVQDCWTDNYAGAPADGSASNNCASSSSRVLRGGSWGISPRFLRSAVRNFSPLTSGTASSGSVLQGRTHEVGAYTFGFLPFYPRVKFGQQSGGMMVWGGRGR